MKSTMYVKVVFFCTAAILLLFFCGSLWWIVADMWHQNIAVRDCWMREVTFTALVCYSRRWSLGVTLWIIVGLLARYLFWILPQKLLLVENGLICGDLYLVQLDCIGGSEYIFRLERTPAYKTVYFAWMYGQTTFELVTFFPCLVIVVANL